MSFCDKHRSNKHLDTSCSWLDGLENVGKGGLELVELALADNQWRGEPKDILAGGDDDNSLAQGFLLDLLGSELGGKFDAAQKTETTDVAHNLWEIGAKLGEDVVKQLDVGLHHGKKLLDLAEDCAGNGADAGTAAEGGAVIAGLLEKAEQKQTTTTTKKTKKQTNKKQLIQSSTAFEREKQYGSPWLLTLIN